MRKTLSFLLVLCMLFCLVPFSAAAEELLISPSPVDGSVITVTTSAEFLQLAENCRLDSFSVGKTVSLEADIDLTGLNFQEIPIFSGIFLGNGHTITGLNLTSAGSTIGLFRILTETAVVTELHVTGTVAPEGSRSTVGGIAGINSGSISFCTFEGTVSGADYVGGIAGINTVTGIIEECAVSGLVHGSHFVGGIAGESAGVIRICQNRAEINTTIEQNTVSLEDITLESITSSESAATVTDIGGICGIGTGLIRECVNLGKIGYPQIGYNVGGIAGTYSGYIDNCSNEGAIHGRKEVGGIVGQLEPIISMSFAEDTLQILQRQMETMSALTDRTASSVKDGASSLEAQIGDLENHIASVNSALETLLPDEENPLPPDADTILAAQNALSSSITAISGTLESMGGTGESMLSNTFKNIQALSNQMNTISSTLGSANNNLNASFTDISDQDTDQDTSGKVNCCTNLASVSGDWNIGGIVGAICIENDLDPESDLDIFGSTSANFACEFRAVINGCENNGTVNGKKQNTGGITGWMSMGLTKDCVNAGTVTGNDHTGGICGLSQGYIRSCIARCLISGSIDCGGVAGEGATVTGCSALVQMEITGEKYGAILGSMDEDTVLEHNYYLPVNGDIGAVDGISYADKAQPLAAMEFFELESLPEEFHFMNVTFHFEDGTDTVVTVPYGSKLAGKLIPQIKPIPGFESAWVGPVPIGAQLFFDTEFTISHTAHIPTLESSAESSDGKPLLLAQGDFMQDDVLSVGVSQNHWELSLPAQDAPLQLRFLLPEHLDAEYIKLQLQTGDGSWKDTDFTLEGSYLVFSADSQVQALRLEEIPRNYTPYMIAGVCVIILLIIGVLILRKKEKR